jgi:hypothetical protein
MPVLKNTKISKTMTAKLTMDFGYQKYTSEVFMLLITLSAHGRYISNRRRQFSYKG